MSEQVAVDALQVEINAAKRGPGRPKGLGKVPGSGRKPGTPNKSTAQTRERIQDLADPIAFLSDVMAGKRMVAAGEPGEMSKTWCYPTLAQRVQAGETLLRKLLPDLKATELTGAAGGPIETIETKALSSVEAARRIAFALASGIEANRRLDETWVLDVGPEPEPDPEPEPEPRTDDPETPVEPGPPADPSLPKHSYIFTEAGTRERSGHRAWLAMAGSEILNTFHGADARRLARDWVARKYNAIPESEIDNPIAEETA